MITSGLKFLQLIFDEKVPRKVYNVKSGFISEERKYSAGNREHCPQNSREQGTFMKNLGTREHWLKNSREQGTVALKAPGTGNIGLKTAGSREHSMKSCVGTTNPSMEERYMRYYVKFGCLQVQNSHLRPFKSFFTLDSCLVSHLILVPIKCNDVTNLLLFKT